jgi:hypothetical protein
LVEVVEFPHAPRPRLVPGEDEGIPAELRHVARDIEAGSFAGLDAIIVVLSGEAGVMSFPVGRDVSIAEAIGLLEMAKADMLSGGDGDYISEGA